MVDTQIITEDIKNLSWPFEQREIFLKLWNFLKPSEKDFFYKEVMTFGSEIMAPYINKSITLVLDANNSLVSNQIKMWQDILLKSPDDPDFDLGRYVIPFLPSLRYEINKNPSFKILLEPVRKFELLLLEELTKDNFLSIISYDLIFLIANSSLNDRFEYLYFHKNDPSGLRWKNACLSALVKNSELLGENNIVLENKGEDKIVEPTIGNWLTDYENRVRVGSGQKKRGGFDQVSYSNGSINSGKLSKDLRNVLLKVLKFYDLLRFESLEISSNSPDSIQQKNYINTQNFILKEKDSVNNVAEPIKKVDIQEILNKGAGVRMSNQVTGDPSSRDDGSSRYGAGELRVTSKIQEQTKPVVMEPKAVPPVVPVKQVTSQIADRTNGADKANVTQDLNQIRLEIEKKKQMAQAQIDKRLEELKRKTNN